jgi:Peptidase family S41
MKLFQVALYFLTAVSGAMLYTASAYSQNSDGQLSAEDVKLDVRVLKRSLIALHPALTKYRTQSEVDQAFAKFEGRGLAARTATEMYLAASELAAAIRCGHTWTNLLNQSPAVKKRLIESADKLPFHLTLVEGRWLVLASADSLVKAGDEVIAVNGFDASTMLSMLMPYLRADGSSDGKRLVQLNHDRLDFSQLDILWPLLSPPTSGQYEITLQNAANQRQTIQVNAITISERQKILGTNGTKPIDKTWRFTIENNLAIMTLPSFSFWNDSFDWAKFIDDGFNELNAKGVPNLVIDIRHNEGGSGEIGSRILSYLITKPLTYVSDQSITNYERVPYNLVRYLDTWDYRFFDRTGQVEKITSGNAQGKFRFLPAAKGEQTIAPASKRYQGRVFLLVSAENSSATFILAMQAKQSNVVTLIGQRTGGNMRGLNGNQMMWVTLPKSGVSVDIPLLAVPYLDTTPDSSQLPDILVTPTIAGRRAGRDEEMDAVKRAIASKK